MNRLVITVLCLLAGSTTTAHAQETPAPAPLAIEPAEVCAAPQMTAVLEGSGFAKHFPVDCARYPAAPGCERKWWRCQDLGYCETARDVFEFPDRMVALALSTQVVFLDRSDALFLGDSYVPQLGLWLAFDVVRTAQNDWLRFALAFELAYAVDASRSDKLFGGAVGASQTTHTATLGLQLRWFPPGLEDWLSMHTRTAFGFENTTLALYDTRERSKQSDTQLRWMPTTGVGLTFLPLGLMLELGRTWPAQLNLDLGPAARRAVSRHATYFRASFVLRW